MPGPLRSTVAALLFVFIACSQGIAAILPEQADKKITLPVPENVPLVLQIRGIEHLHERIVKLLNALPPTEAKWLNGYLKDVWKSAFADRRLDAIPDDGRAFIVVHSLTLLNGDLPPFSVLLPITNYQQFRTTFLTADERKTFEKGARGIDTLRFTGWDDDLVLFAIDLKDYVALTPNKPLAELYAGPYARTPVAALKPELLHTFLNADLALYLDMELVNEAHGEDIRSSKAFIEFAFKQAQANSIIPGLNQTQASAVLELIDRIFQGIEDCRGLVVALEMPTAGVHLRVQARFRDRCSTNDLLRGEKPTAFNELPRLPSRMGEYSALASGEKFSKLFHSFRTPFQAGPEDEAGASLITNGLAELAAAKPGISYSAEGHHAYLHVTAYQNPAKARNARTKIYHGLVAGARVDHVVLKQAPRVLATLRKHRQFTFTEIHLNREFGATVATLPESAREAALERLKRSGHEHMILWLGNDDKVLIQLVAADWTSAEKLLDAYLDNRGTLHSEAAFLTTRSHLPAQATFIALFETRTKVKLVVNYLHEVLKPFSVDLPPLARSGDSKSEPSYLGMALTLEPQSIQLDFFVPTQSLGVAVRMLAPIIKSLE